MSLPALIDLRVCWDKDTKSTEFVYASLSLINEEESLLDAIKREVRKKMVDETRTINYEHDIKSVINEDGKDLSQIIRVPLSRSIVKLGRRRDDDIAITVVLDKPAPAFSAASAKPAAAKKEGQTIAGLSRFILSPECKSVVVLTGAGVSVASGM